MGQLFVLIMNEFCVVCAVEMVFPGCAGLTTHAYKKDICGTCFHSTADHNAAKISELKVKEKKGGGDVFCLGSFSSFFFTGQLCKRVQARLSYVRGS